MSYQRKPVLEVAVSYGTVTLKPNAVKLGIAIRAVDLPIAEAYRHLCGHRLAATLLARPDGAGATQQGLPGLDGDTTLRGEFDVKQLSLPNAATITATLSFPLTPEILDDLGRFAKREGILTIEQVGDLPAGADKSDEAE